MVGAVDLIKFAAKHGLSINISIAREAIASVDRKTLEDQEHARWQVVPWDGTGEPPVGEREHWIHDKDGIGQLTKQAFDQGHMVYFLMKDGTLQVYQPFRAHVGGLHKLRKDPEHEHHWEKAGNDHINHMVEDAVDKQVIDQALEKSLELHEEKGVPVAVAPSYDADKGVNA